MVSNEIKFQDVNHLTLGTKIKVQFSCDVVVGEEVIPAYCSTQLVHEQHEASVSRDERVHWYIPGTEMFIPNALLRSSEILEITLNFNNENESEVI